VKWNLRAIFIARTTANMFQDGFDIKWHLVGPTEFLCQLCMMRETQCSKVASDV